MADQATRTEEPRLADFAGTGCPSAFIGNRDPVGEWIAWRIAWLKWAVRRG
jgi:hypothetical protein